MDIAHRNLLQKNRVTFAQDLDLDEVVQFLVNDNILSDRMVQEIRSEKTDFGRNVAFLTKLPSRGPQAFHVFCQALENTGQSYLAQLLSPNPISRCGNSSALGDVTHLSSTPNSPPSAFSFTEQTPPKNSRKRTPPNFDVSCIPCTTPKMCKIRSSKPLDTYITNTDTQSPTAANEPDENGEARVPVEQMDFTAEDSDFKKPDNRPCSYLEALRSNTSMENLRLAANLLPNHSIAETVDNHISADAKGVNHTFHQVFDIPRANEQTVHLASDAPTWENVNVKPSTVEFLQNHMHDCYPMFSSCKGVMLLINVLEFEPSACLDNRSGGEKDDALLELTFKQLQYDVYKLVNGTASEILNTLKNFAAWPKLREYDSCFVVLMSHGLDGVIFGRDGHSVTLKDAYEVFSNEKCPQLQNKPKIFMVQACRGDQPDKGTDQIDGPSSNKGFGKSAKRRLLEFDNRRVFNKLPTMSDCLVAYATVPGFAAMRNTERGSWFIQAFVQNLAYHARNKSILEIMTMTNNQVKGREGWSPDSEFHRCKEMSEFTSCLCKPFYFFPGIYLKKATE